MSKLNPCLWLMLAALCASVVLVVFVFFTCSAARRQRARRAS